MSDHNPKEEKKEDAVMKKTRGGSECVCAEGWVGGVGVGGGVAKGNNQCSFGWCPW